VAPDLIHCPGVIALDEIQRLLHPVEIEIVVLPV